MLGEELSAYVGPPIAFSGRLSGWGNARIEGAFEGDIALEGLLTVGPSGRVRAVVRADTVSVAGEVIGDVEGRTLVEVHAGGRIEGDVTAPEVIVDDGAEITGAIHRTGRIEHTEKVPPPERAVRIGSRVRAKIRR